MNETVTKYWVTVNGRMWRLFDTREEAARAIDKEKERRKKKPGLVRVASTFKIEPITGRQRARM